MDKDSPYKTILNHSTAVIGLISGILSGVVLMYLGGLKTDLLSAKSEAKSNFDKLEVTARVNFEQIHLQLQNHLSRHQQLDKELCERLSKSEVLLETILDKNNR